jgi:hypothetical protein
LGHDNPTTLRFEGVRFPRKLKALTRFFSEFFGQVTQPPENGDNAGLFLLFQ